MANFMLHVFAFVCGVFFLICVFFFKKKVFKKGKNSKWKFIARLISQRMAKFWTQKASGFPCLLYSSNSLGEHCAASWREHKGHTTQAHLCHPSPTLGLILAFLWAHLTCLLTQGSLCIRVPSSHAISQVHSYIPGSLAQPPLVVPLPCAGWEVTNSSCPKCGHPVSQEAGS